MKFIDYLYDADGCFCDNLYNYDDIQLQGVFGIRNGIDYTYTLKVEAYTLDGNTLINDVTSSFGFEVHKIANSNSAYVNIISKRIPDELCNIKCFRLKVELKGSYTLRNQFNTSIMFSSFTDCMHVMNCCVIIPSKGIKIEPIIIEE